MVRLLSGPKIKRKVHTRMSELLMKSYVKTPHKAMCSQPIYANIVSTWKILNY